MRNNNRPLGSVMSGARAPLSFNANIHEAADMYVLPRQLESTRLNWLRQQQNTSLLQNDYTQPSSDSLPELVGLFDNSSSANADMFDWQGKPDSYLDDDDINFSEIFRPEAELDSEKLAGTNNGGSEMNQCFRETCSRQVVEKESDTDEEGVVLIIDSDSESSSGDNDDMVMQDCTSAISTERNNFSLLEKRKAEIAVQEGYYPYEKRRKVDAASVSDSVGAIGNKAKASGADASKASEGWQKPTDYKRGRAKYTSRNPEIHSLAEKVRRQKINDKLQCLLQMIPGNNKENNSRLEKLDNIIFYTKFLQNQCTFLSEKSKPQNPTPEENINKLFAPKPKSPGYVPNCAANVSLSAVNTNFAYLMHQMTANYVPNYWRQQAFAPQIAPPIPSTSAMPIRQQHLYNVQGQPIVWDPESLSLLYEKLYCC